MKKRSLVAFAIVLAILLPSFAHAHEENENEYQLSSDELYPVGQLEMAGYGSIAFGALIVIILLFHKKMKNNVKKVVFYLVAIVSIFVTVYLIITTLHLNIISLTKGPVHWHADFEIWVCDKQVEIAKPQRFLSNKQGVELLHAHSDNRIHVEGVVLDLKQASLGAFFQAIGGHITETELEVPTDNGLVSVSNGYKCNEQPGKLYVFVNGNQIQNYRDYSISHHERVPPGDRIKIIFTEIPMEQINPLIEAEKYYSK
ncbi:MAG TPA: hypothetical protein VI564_00540 [Candidatus Nanoarchaeia archaeon]|nr:hypothetical protein [Candidatus Nanoarchaeia archaeon]